MNESANRKQEKTIRLRYSEKCNNISKPQYQLNVKLIPYAYYNFFKF